MANPICPKCGGKLSNKADVNLEGISGGVSERMMNFYIVYCQKCGYPIGTLPKV